MKLTELAPTFLIRESDQTFRMTDAITGAEGIQFDCPKCWTKNGGPVGTHIIICWTPAIPQSMSPMPGRWNLVGTGYQDLSLVAGSSSVKLLAGCMAHFMVTNGEVTPCEPFV